MTIGMLWFDNDPKADLETKIRRAAEYYAGKYGRRPNQVFVHPKAGTVTVEGIMVKPDKSILPNHFWVGVEDQA